MPQAAQIVDRFHVVQLLMRATDPVRCAERGASPPRSARKLAGTKYVWLKRREELDPAKTHLREARACQMAKAMQDVYSCADRKSAGRAPECLCSWMMHSAVAEMKAVARLSSRGERLPHRH